MAARPQSISSFFIMNRLTEQRPALQTRVELAPHPSGGRGFFYSQDMREFAMHIFQNNQLNNPAIQHARGLWLFPSLPTIRRYVVLLNMFGHFRPCRRTGNKRAVVLRDHNIIFLVLYRMLSLNAQLLKSMHSFTVLTMVMSTSGSTRMLRLQRQKLAWE